MWPCTNRRRLSRCSAVSLRKDPTEIPLWPQLAGFPEGRSSPPRPAPRPGPGSGPRWSVCCSCPAGQRPAALLLTGTPGERGPIPPAPARLAPCSRAAAGPSPKSRENGSEGEPLPLGPQGRFPEAVPTPGGPGATAGVTGRPGARGARPCRGQAPSRGREGRREALGQALPSPF